MSINQYLNFTDIAENHCDVQDEYGNDIELDLYEDECSISSSKEGLFINIVMGSDNGIDSNNPNYHENKIIFTLNEDLDVINRIEQ